MLSCKSHVQLQHLSSKQVDVAFSLHIVFNVTSARALVWRAFLCFFYMGDTSSRNHLRISAASLS